jgi:hypothetical protein
MAFPLTRHSAPWLVSLTNHSSEQKHMVDHAPPSGKVPNVFAMVVYSFIKLFPDTGVLAILNNLLTSCENDYVVQDRSNKNIPDRRNTKCGGIYFNEKIYFIDSSLYSIFPIFGYGRKRILHFCYNE